MELNEAQEEVRRGFVGGGPGVIVSGLIWSAAALAEAERGVAFGFAVLFVGGMLIYPASLLVARFVFRRAALQRGNGLTPIALESTLAMIGGLFAAFLFLPHEPALVLPLAALAVGAHYFVFRTLYGEVLFLVLGMVISALALNATFEWVALPISLAWCVAVVEILFGAILTVRNRV
jgi:hypothetical protein